jgi:hypothetical protein
MYFLFPETKGRTLEEIGHVFGDDVHVAHNWYSATEEEKMKIEQMALKETEGGRLPEKSVNGEASQVEEIGSVPNGPATTLDENGKA